MDSMEHIVTKYGDAYYAKADDIVYLPRHRPGHTLPPHMINYRANVQALIDLGVDAVVSIYAVGSITRRLSPGRFGLVRDFIDLAFFRENTFYDGSTREVRHTPFVEPFDRRLGALFARNAVKASFTLALDSIYITTNGPRLETPAEITAYRNMGADVVGMTLATEASLLKELGLRYSALAYSINWAQGVRGGEMSFISSSDTSKLCRHILDTALRALS